jgi:outer membrane immunogenic protein
MGDGPMKKFILAAAIFPLFSFAAFAADLPNTKGPPTFAPPPPPPAWTWTGFYVGVNAGGAFLDSHAASVPGLPPFAPFSMNGSGFMGGGQAGFNYQFGQFVAGVEVGGDGLTVRGHNQCSTTLGTDCVTHQSVVGTFEGRFGFTPIDRVLIYGTGGGAVTRFSFAQDLPAFQGWNAGTRAGWTAGGGVEYAIPGTSLIVGVEYKFYDFGTMHGVGGVAPTTIDFRETESSVVGRLSYKFDLFAPPAPVVAKY